MMSLMDNSEKERFALGLTLMLAIAAWTAPWAVSPSGAQEPGAVTVTGVVLSHPGGGGVGTWRVGPYEVRVTAETRVRQDNGPIRLGAEVEVQGLLRERHTVEAQVITALRTGRETVKLVGLVDALPAEGLIGTWTVAGVSVQVAESTEIDETKGAVEVGALVKVEGAANEDGSIGAASVTVQRVAGIRPVTCEFVILKLRPPAETEGTGEGVVLWRHRGWADGTEQVDLRVAVEELAPESEFSVTFDSFDVGTILTNDEGEGRLWLSTETKDNAQPLPAELEDLSGFTAAQVAATAGQVVLAGAFAEARYEECGKPGLDYLAVAPLVDGEGRLIGSATARVTSEEQNLDALASGLAPLEVYRLVIDGVDAGTAAARECGHWSLQFSTAANGRELPLPEDLDPVSGLLHVELRTVEGDVLVAEGSFAPVVPVGPVATGGPVRKRIGR